MSVKTLRGDALKRRNVWIAVPSNIVAGAKFYLTISNKIISATATSTSVSDLASLWLAAIAASSFPEWKEVTADLYQDELGVVRGITMTGPEDGTPIVVSESSTAATITVDVTTVQNGAAGKNNIQRVALQVTPTGGTFTITYNGSTTGAIAYNASNGTIQTALEGLTGIGAGNVTVTGATGTWYVEFIGTLAQTQLNKLSGSGASLTGAGSVYVQTTTQGKPATNFVQRIISDTSPAMDIVASLSINGSVVTSTLSFTFFMTAAYVESILQGFAGVPQVRVTKNETAAQPYFEVEWMGIYAGTSNAELTYISGTGSISRFTEPSPTGTNEVQFVRLLGTPTGGTYALTFGASTTAGIAYNAVAATVETAFTGLASVGASNCTVAGSYTAGFTFTFANTLGSQNVAAITGSGASLTGATFLIDDHYQNALAQVNEKQQVKFSSTPASGNYKLTYSSQQTANIAYNATSATVAAALIALSNIAASEVTVSGDYLAGFLVTFLLTLGGSDLSEMTGQNVSLAGPGTQDITLTESVTGSGPNWWSAADNWAPNGVPADGDTIILTGSVQLKYGLNQSGIDPVNIIARADFSEGVGLDDINEKGYWEYRDKDLIIGTAAGTVPYLIGQGEGQGAKRFRVDGAATIVNMRILKTQVNPDLPTVLLKGGATGAASRVELLRGTFAFNYTEGDTGTLADLVCGFVDNIDGDAYFMLGSGSTVTQITQDGGVGLNFSTGYKMLMRAGNFRQERSGWTCAEWKQQGGYASMIGSGTISSTVKLSGPALLEGLSSDQQISLANPIEVYGDSADIIDPRYRFIASGQVYKIVKYINTTRFGRLGQNHQLTIEPLT